MVKWSEAAVCVPLTSEWDDPRFLENVPFGGYSYRFSTKKGVLVYFPSADWDGTLPVLICIGTRDPPSDAAFALGCSIK